jgi:hypothetical protein
MITPVIFREPEAQQEHDQEKEARVQVNDPSHPLMNPPFPSHVRWEIVKVTPADAQRYLDTMHTNRIPSKLETAVMEQNLRDGTFFPAISPVYFDDGDPELGLDRAWDGQHRFKAIADTGIPAYLQFIRGITAEEADHVDTGRRRAFADNLRRHEVWDYKRQAVVARYLANYYTHGLEAVRNMSKYPVTQDQQRAYVDSPGIEEAIKMAASIYRTVGGNEPLLAYSMLRTAEWGKSLDPEVPGLRELVKFDPDGFWGSVRSGENLKQGDPAKTLRDWLMKGRVRSRRPADQRLMMAYCLSTAWNAHVQGRSLSRFQPPFEKRAHTGESYFPSSAVQDYIQLGAEPELLSRLRNARNQLERERARKALVSPAVPRSAE